MNYNYICNNDPWSCYLGKVISVMVEDKTQPFRGRLLKIDKNYLYLERLNGNITTILRSTITRITTTRDRIQVI
jgi:hypothetical protein